MASQMSTLERVIDHLANEETSDQLTTLNQEMGEECKRVVESLSPPTLEHVINQFIVGEDSDQLVDLGQGHGIGTKEAQPQQTPPFECSNCSAHFD